MSGFWNFEIYEHIYVVDDITYTYWTIKYLGLWVFIFKSEFCVYLKKQENSIIQNNWWDICAIFIAHWIP